MYAQWRPGEPNNAGNGEACAVMGSSGYLDIHCSKVYVSVCRAPAPELCTELPHPAFPGLVCYKRHP